MEAGHRLRRLSAQVCAATAATDELPQRDPRFTRSGGTAMVHFPQIVGRALSTTPQMPSICANVWLEEFATSPIPGKEMTAGLVRQNSGSPLEFVYSYEEMRMIVEGECHLTDGTGQKLFAEAGDLMYFPKGSRVTFETPTTVLWYFCSQRAKDAASFGEPAADPDLKEALAANPRMVHFPKALKAPLPKMAANATERDSQTWLGDIACSRVPGKELACGLYRMNAGNALEYYYDYEEMKYIVEGEFHLADGTGQHVVAKAGDLMYFPIGSSIVFDTPKTALGLFCGQRLEDVPCYGIGDFGQHRLSPMLFAGPLDGMPIPLTFLPPDRPMDGRQMALCSLDVNSRWLMIDATYKAQATEKAKLLASPELMKEVVVTEEDVEPEVAAKTLAAKKETLKLVVAYLLRRYPAWFECRGNIMHNKLLEEQVVLDSGEDPLLTAVRLIQEDICICEPTSEPDNGVVRVSCGVVFFPMRWSLREKVGRRLPAVHGPVPVVQKHYLKSFPTFFRELDPNSPVSRGNWAIFDDVASREDLYQPMSSATRAKDWPKPTSIADASKKYFYRAEYQTLRKLPETGATVFTIRTYQLPLEDFSRYPYEASVLASRIRTIDSDFASYKNASSWTDWALKYLDSIADPSAATQGAP